MEEFGEMGWDLETGFGVEADARKKMKWRRVYCDEISTEESREGS